MTTAYDDLAPAYDLLTEGYDHERWIAAIEDLAAAHGVRVRRVLDVACGTGKSFLPWLRRGCEVTAVDVSAEMAAIARAKAAGRAAVAVADMRALPRFGAFDLVTCLDDALNHLLTENDVAAALAGIRRNLAPGGLAVFDANTLAAYRAVPDHVAEDARHLVLWRGAGATLTSPGGLAEVTLDVLSARDDELWSRATVRWRHRHHPLARLRALAERAGLAVLAVHGQSPGAVLDDEADEERHPKALFVCGRDRRGEVGRCCGVRDA